MLETLGITKDKIEERILAAAISLFGLRGYNGVSMRDIALTAKVNEVTVYRHYAHKRDLYVASLSAELERVHLGGAMLREIAEAPDAKEALMRAFCLIENTLCERPEMLRLLLYGSLESAADVDVLLRRHLGEFVQILTGYLAPWVIKEEAPGQSAHGMVLGLAAIAVFYQSLERLFPPGPSCKSAVVALTGHCPGGKNESAAFEAEMMKSSFETVD